jgi:hypothetical protein
MIRVLRTARKKVLISFFFYILLLWTMVSESPFVLNLQYFLTLFSPFS